MSEAKPSLVDELKRRNVFRVAAMYAVTGWSSSRSARRSSTCSIYPTDPSDC
jgi:hypothetical protein